MKSIKLVHPTRDQVMDARRVYEETYERARALGVYNKNEMSSVLRRLGIFTNEMQEELKSIEDSFFFKYPFCEEIATGTDLQKNVFADKCLYEIFKGERTIQVKDLFTTAQNSTKEPSVPKYKSTAKRYRELVLAKRDYIKRTCEGLADTASNERLIYHCCRHGETGEKLWSSLDRFYNSRNRVFITILSMLCTDFMGGYSSTVLRFIAKHPAWKVKWLVAVNLSKDLFREPIEEWDTNKTFLSYWSTFYDNVAESHEPPEEYIVKDDELLDAFLENKRKEYDNDRNRADPSADDGMKAHFRTSVNPIKKGK